MDNANVDLTDASLGRAYLNNNANDEDGVTLNNNSIPNSQPDNINFPSTPSPAAHSMDNSRPSRTRQPDSGRRQMTGNRVTGGGLAYSNYQSAPSRGSDFPLRILVLSDMVGAIIGKSGGTIKAITQETRARVDVHRKDNSGSLEKVITIFGTPENCSKACLKIMEVMAEEATATARTEPIALKILAHNNLIGRIIGKSGNTIKHIMAETDTKIAVSTNLFESPLGSSFNPERVITIKGDVEAMARAEALISAKLRQSYEADLAVMPMAFPAGLVHPGHHPGLAMMPHPASFGGHRGPSGPLANPGYYQQPYPGLPPVMPYGQPGGAGGPGGPGPFVMSPSGGPAGMAGGPDSQTKETVFLYIPNTAVGAIIGTGGSTIRDMISSSGATIKVAQPKDDLSPQPPSGSPTETSSPPSMSPLIGPSERKVTIVGTPEAQWKAQFMLFRKVAYEGQSGPQEASLTVEIMVPSSQVGRIIGKSGQTVRELQRLTHATIKLPEEGHNAGGPSDETPVHIKGDFISTQNAQRQIRALVTRASQSPSHGPGGSQPGRSQGHRGSGDHGHGDRRSPPGGARGRDIRPTDKPGATSNITEGSDEATGASAATEEEASRARASPVAQSAVTATPSEAALSA